MSKIVGAHFKPNLPPTFQKFTSGSGTYNKNYYFQIAPGSATVGATYTNNGVTFTVYATVSGATQVVMSGSGPPSSSGVLTRASGSGDATLSFIAFFAPTSLRVRLVGGGAGGAGGSSGGADGGAGGATTFGSSLLTANGGAATGTVNSTPGQGGTATVSAPAIGVALRGGDGNPSGANASNGSGGNGGSSFFGGAGLGHLGQAGVGGAAGTNTGGGGGGCGTTGASGGGGGGAGGFVDAIIYSPSATYAWAVGAAGTAGAGANGGGLGGSGVIEVTEFYT